MTERISALLKLLHKHLKKVEGRVDRLEDELTETQKILQQVIEEGRK